MGWFVILMIKEDVLVGSSGQQINHSLGKSIFLSQVSTPADNLFGS